MSFEPNAEQSENLKIVRVWSWRFSVRKGWWRHTDGFLYFRNGRQVNIWGEAL